MLQLQQGNTLSSIGFRPEEKVSSVSSTERPCIQMKIKGEITNFLLFMLGLDQACFFNVLLPTAANKFAEILSLAKNSLSLAGIFLSLAENLLSLAKKILEFKKIP